ncbi:MAG: trp RNA-binding attenuation protein MtrB [Clostridia bacterium]|nr:trp RNA-binding attenuation protein MtrB [Clostridia bacterium]
MSNINDDPAIEMKQIGDYIAVKAEENGVSVIGLTCGRDTRFHHTEKMDKNEVVIMQFTEHTAAIKIKGNAVIYTKHGMIKTF